MNALSAGNTSARRMAANFTRGINAFIDYLKAHHEQMPWDFKHLGYEPARWAPEDVVRIRSHGITRNLQSEVSRARAACAGSLASDEFRVGLQPPWETKVPEGLDPCLSKDILEVFQLATRGVRLSRETKASGAKAEVRLVSAAEGTHDLDFFMDGSNNWVISPRRSATGRAILANDPSDRRDAWYFCYAVVVLRGFACRRHPKFTQTVDLIEEVKAFGKTLGIEPTDALRRTTQGGPSLSMLWLWMQREGTLALDGPVDIRLAVSELPPACDANLFFYDIDASH